MIDHDEFSAGRRREIGETTYYLPDIIVESVLREAIAVVKRNPEIIDHVFRSLKQYEKYGQQEIERIKRHVCKYDWSFVHSFDLVEENVPCISIQLMTEVEAPETHLNDYDTQQRIPLAEVELPSLVVVPAFTPTGYDPMIGAVYVDDTINLLPVHANLLFQDVTGKCFKIEGGINEALGAKQFMIAAGSLPDVSGPCLVKSAIDFKQYSVRSTMTDVNILLGVHTKEPLLTKYFYILLKYFLMARKQVLIERGFLASKFQGSDFTRNLKIEGDSVYNRFLTLSGKVEDSFRSDETEIFDHIDIVVKVPRDVASTEDLGYEHQVIQVTREPEDE